jgi:Aldo/keto reductase family
VIGIGSPGSEEEFLLSNMYLTLACRYDILRNGDARRVHAAEVAGRAFAGEPRRSQLDAADALGALADEAGLTLIQMAAGFVIRHPAVTSAIIGPRTMEHLDGYLAADGPGPRQPQRTRTLDCQAARTAGSPVTVTPARVASTRFHRNR